MVFRTRVKYNGIHYPAGVDVPIPVEELDEYQATEEQTVKAEEPVQKPSTELTLKSCEGRKSGETYITVDPPLASGNRYKYKVAVDVSLPAIGQNLRTWTTWNGSSNIAAETGKKICIAEVDADYKAVRAGITTVTAR